MGIGQGIAVELACRGAEVAIHYAHTEPEETVSQIEKLGAKAATVQGDLSKVADCERTVEAAAEALGGLDTLVNNAGVTKTLDFLDTDEKTYDSVFDLNMKGYFFLAKRAVPYMMNLPRLRRGQLCHGTGPLRGRRDHRLGRRQFLAGSALASAALLLAGCRREAAQQASQGGGGGSGGNFPNTPEWNFVFVNHVTTNPFFVPTQYGIEDAQALLGTTSQWQGSEQSVVREMVDAMNSAISGDADGIAVSIVDPEAFNEPIQKALDNGIPVIAYNANGEGPGTNPALAYVGQDLFQSGVEMGKRIVSIVDEGLVALFIATPGQLNIQPRIDGAKQSIEDSGKNIEIQQVATSANVTEERSRIEAWYNGHKDVAGMFAVDAGSTQGTAQVMAQFGLHDKGVKAGGYDLTPQILENLGKGHIDFTIDQQPYLQGFLPVIQLYLYKISGGVTGPAETNTGLVFITPETVDRYLETASRFEGDSEVQKIVKAPS